MKLTLLFFFLWPAKMYRIDNVAFILTSLETSDLENEDERKNQVRSDFSLRDPCYFPPSSLTGGGGAFGKNFAIFFFFFVLKVFLWPNRIP